MAPRPEVRRYVRNQSSRNGVKPQLVVLHSTESHNRPGLVDLKGLGGWFDNGSAQASSHAANDGEGYDARFVPDSRKAWTCAGYNSLSLNLEQIGHAAQTTWPDKQLRNTAEWIAYWAKLHGIPIQHAAVSAGRVTRPGVVMHSELGQIGGGHHDPGTYYPLGKVIEMAQALEPEVRKQKAWQARLTHERARLKSLLALRARLRQRKLEDSARYRESTKELSDRRNVINRLKRLIGRKP
jgi:hypothetical protein